MKRPFLMACAGAALVACANPVVVPTPVSTRWDGGRLATDGFCVRDCGEAGAYALERAGRWPKGNTPLVFKRDGTLAEQAYRLAVTAEGVTVSASSPAGFSYALATLGQITEKTADGGFAVPTGTVDDRPAYRLRGVNWNLFVETRGWSQDAGDGIENFRKRFVAALDRLVDFKLNAAMVDGIGWNPERFPGYGKLMRELGAEARKRSVRLGFAGYTAGYGAQWFDRDGPSFRNLRKWDDPSEKPYRCIGLSGNEQATMGTCLSNQELTRRKLENVRDFARSVRPGFMYAHGVDLGEAAGACEAWSNRCARCRAAWPDDDPNSPRGMAGAYADFYDRLYETVAAEAPDCILNVIAPNYSKFDESDTEWDFHVAYFRTLTACVRHREIRFMLREQYMGEDGRMRFGELRRAVAPGTKLSVIAFGAGDAFLNTLPASGEVGCCRYFNGADEVVVGGGNAFQEPRQALWAEYLWNPTGTAFPVAVEATRLAEFRGEHAEMINGFTLPPAIFRKGDGLFDVVCAKLYGADAGRTLSQALRPQTFEDGAFRATVAPIFPLVSERLPGSAFSRYRKGKYKLLWRGGLTDDEYAAFDFERRLTERSIVATRTAAEAFRKAGRMRDAEVCELGARLGELTVRWLALPDEARPVLAGKGDRAAFLKRIDELEAELKELERFFLAKRKAMVDISGGNANDGLRTVTYLLAEIENVRETFRSGKYPPHPVERWW